MEQWEKNYYISAIAGSNNGSSLVVMSKGKRRIMPFLWRPVTTIAVLYCFLLCRDYLKEVCIVLYQDTLSLQRTLAGSLSWGPQPCIELPSSYSS